MIERPVPSLVELSEIPIRASEGAGFVVVYKPYAGEYWARLYATPNSDVGATLLTTPEQFADVGLDFDAVVTDPIPVPLGGEE